MSDIMIVHNIYDLNHYRSTDDWWAINSNQWYRISRMIDFHWWGTENMWRAWCQVELPRPHFPPKHFPPKQWVRDLVQFYIAFHVGQISGIYLEFCPFGPGKFPHPMWGRITLLTPIPRFRYGGLARSTDRQMLKNEPLSVVIPPVSRVALLLHVE